MYDVVDLDILNTLHLKRTGDKFARIHRGPLYLDLFLVGLTCEHRTLVRQAICIEMSRGSLLTIYS